MNRHENEKSSHFLLGIGIGTLLGLLFAPRTGKETRERLKEDAKVAFDKGSKAFEDAKITYSVAREEIDPVLEEVSEKLAPYVEKIKNVSQPYRKDLVDKIQNFIEDNITKELKRKIS